MFSIMEWDEMGQKYQYLAQNDQKCIFWSKFGLFGQAWDQMFQKCQYLSKKANFEPNLAIYGPKILFFMAVSKSFGTNITETT